MKISVAQTRPFKGDFLRNKAQHIRLIERAAACGAEVLLFPELSLTGYEPELARDLAMRAEDSRLDDFQQQSDAHRMILGVGMPTIKDSDIRISLLLFQPHQPRETHVKHYLHPDEEPFFSPGPQRSLLLEKPLKTALAICYELAVPEHAELAAQNGAQVYLASVAKSVAGVEKALETLADGAARYSMIVLMANCVGHCDNFDCGGQTSIWNRRGERIGQLDDAQEGLLIFDTETGEVIRTILEADESPELSA